MVLGLASIRYQRIYEDNKPTGPASCAGLLQLHLSDHVKGGLFTEWLMEYTQSLIKKPVNVSDLMLFTLHLTSLTLMMENIENTLQRSH